MFQIVISVEHIMHLPLVNVYIYMSGKAADTRECVNTLHNGLENKEYKYESCGFEWWRYSCNVNCNPYKVKTNKLVHALLQLLYVN